MKEGEIVDARITTMDQTGAWIDINGFQAFVPLPEISWYEIEHPSAMVAEGAWIRAKVIGQVRDGRWECSVRRVESDGSGK